MKRRDLILAASGLAAALPFEAAGQGAAPAQRQYLELRQYFLLPGQHKERFDTFLRNVALPAFKRLGIGPVGAFTVLYGQNVPASALYLLLPHKSLESVAGLEQALASDPEYLKAGAEFLDRPLSDPVFLRYDSSLLLAFEGMPKLEVPAATANKPRLFEMRTYESHSAKAAAKKIEMFNQGGEIAIFRNTGLNPVFFAETLVGPQMPSLTYMLCHESMETRDAGWARFGKDPDWLRLRGMKEYADTVSNISDIILRPTDYSQI
jgi:hypothetical protein